MMDWDGASLIPVLTPMQAAGPSRRESAKEMTRAPV